MEGPEWCWVVYLDAKVAAFLWAPYFRLIYLQNIYSRLLCENIELSFLLNEIFFIRNCVPKLGSLYQVRCRIISLQTESNLRLWHLGGPYIATVLVNENVVSFWFQLTMQLRPTHPYIIYDHFVDTPHELVKFKG